MKTHLDLVKACDNFPYMEEDIYKYEEHLKLYYAFKIEGHDLVLGHLPKTLVKSVHWPRRAWKIDESLQTVTMRADPDSSAAFRSELAQEMVEVIARCRHLTLYKGRSDNYLPVYGKHGEVLLEIEQHASALFGIVLYGAHLTGFTNGDEGLSIWIARRAKSAMAYPGMLDTTCTVPLKAGDIPKETLIAHAAFETSVSDEYLERAINPGDSLSYFHITGIESGKAKGLLQPEVQYVYDAQLEPGLIPRSHCEDIDNYDLLPIGQVLSALRRREFTPRSAVVLIDFFIRHNIIVPENEPYFMEIFSRLHRHLDFPTIDHSI